jgi:hypothetical protein
MNSAANLCGTIHEEIVDRVAGTPTADLYSPHLETLVSHVHCPDDPEWLASAARWTDRDKPVTAMPPVSIPKIVGGHLLTLDDTPRFPPRFWSRIGQSGWDWVNRRARFVTFEFDLADGENHSDGLTDAQLATVEQSLSEHPSIDLRRSTSGAGLHARLYVDPIPCPSRDEYLRIRKAALQALAGQVDIPLLDWFDPNGRAILWIWARGGDA